MGNFSLGKFTIFAALGLIAAAAAMVLMLRADIASHPARGPITLSDP